MALMHAFFRLALVLAVYLVNSTTSSFGHSTYCLATVAAPGIIAPGTYLVVGVFEYEDNAKEFTEYVLELGRTAKYAYYPQSGYYYVYTLSASTLNEVKDAYRQLRNDDSGFNDAWVFVAEPQEARPDLASENDSSFREKFSDIVPNEEYSEGTWDEDTTHSVSAIASNEQGDEQPDAGIVEKREKLGKQQVMHVQFMAHRYENEQPISASIKVVEGVRSKSIADASTSETISIDKLGLLDSVLQIIPYAIGYRKAQFDLPLYITPRDSAGTMINFQEDTLVMSVPLQPLRKGDTQIMFNTYFYGNSSVMRERSRYELAEVVKLMNEKPEMKIKLHGHTNGNGRGFIYICSPEENNFFRLIQNKEHKKKGISSTKLSAMRAETIKRYLENQGISADRVETQGWGGKKMLYPEDSPLSKNNIRVEIEVLEE